MCPLVFIGNFIKHATLRLVGSYGASLYQWQIVPFEENCFIIVHIYNVDVLLAIGTAVWLILLAG